MPLSKILKTKKNVFIEPWYILYTKLKQLPKTENFPKEGEKSCHICFAFLYLAPHFPISSEYSWLDDQFSMHAVASLLYHPEFNNVLSTMISAA